jgi:hypothetical protein
LPDHTPDLDDHQGLRQTLGGGLASGSPWRALLEQSLCDDGHPLAHLAIFQEPYLRYVLQGRKTVESRFGRNLIAPHGVVSAGDLLLLKQVSGPVVGLAKVGYVHSYVLDPLAWREIRERFSAAMCAEDQDFWEDRRDARFATLMQIVARTPIAPVFVAKQDRRGWVVLRGGGAAHENQMELLAGARLARVPEPRETQPRPLVIEPPEPSALSTPLQLSFPDAVFG